MSSGVFHSQYLFQGSDDTLVHKVTQPTEDLILERNNELRKHPEALRDLGSKKDGGTWGRMVASIPFILFEKAIRDGYQLNHKNSEFAGQEMMRYLASPEGQTCKVRDRI